MTDFTLARLASAFLGLSALLHLMSPLTMGIQMALVMVGIALFYAVLILLMAPGRRWVGYIVWICMLAGAIGAYVSAGGSVPAWQAWAILAADLACAATLFVWLWRRAPAEVA